ncbi:MAG TPA: DUF4215 domain-containing protein [bacterium]|nr:DUF4215 domain-containing protein [bacterium]
MAEYRPVGRYDHAMTTDEAHGKVMLFGGKGDGEQELNDLWEWNGATWTQKLPPISSLPANLSGGVITYDESRDSIVLLSSYYTQDEVGYHNFTNTWEWLSGKWALRNPPTIPTFSSGSMMYDGANNEAVLFSYSETWGWNGINWSKKAPSSTPTGNGVLVYDQTREKGLLYTGSETWEWDGYDDSWAKKTTVNIPSASTGFAMAYDAERDKVVLFGGGYSEQYFDPACGCWQTTTTLLEETWEWDGTDWTKMNPSVSPSPRNGSLMIYDSVRRELMLFGGSGAGGFFPSDAWKWDGTEWQQIFPADMPSGPSGMASITYDSISGRTISLSGQTLWELSGGATSRAAQIFSVALNTSGISAGTISGVSARFYAGGIGFPDDAETYGAELRIWDEGRWKTKSTNDADPGTPLPLAWSTASDTEWNSLTSEESQEQLTRLFFGDRRSLNFAVTPVAPNGIGSDMGELVVDYAEVVVSYIVDPDASDLCGDGDVQAGEECDDGNSINEDDCKNDCTFNVCRDGSVRPGVEECDDGNEEENDSCKNDCTRNFCGDGVTRSGFEECDDGNEEDKDTCSNSCIASFCGDGIINMSSFEVPEEVESFEWGIPADAENGGEPWEINASDKYDGEYSSQSHRELPMGSVSIFTLYRGSDDEVCFYLKGRSDQENYFTFEVDAEEVLRTSGASAYEEWQQVCHLVDPGMHYLRFSYVKPIESTIENDGYHIDHIRLHKSFTFIGTEPCDDGNDSNEDDCTNICRPPLCGDGFVWLGYEECDDGNFIDGDGCSGCVIN